MNPQSLRRLSIGRNLSLGAAVLSAGMLTVSLITVLAAPVAGAAENAGSITFATPAGGAGQAGGSLTPVTEGGSALPIALVLPSGAACTGDSATGGYRVQSFMVPASTDIATLKFGSGGPVKPPGATGQWYPLFDISGDQLSARLTDVATTVNGPGAISGLPFVNFSVFGPGDISAGDYAVGVACTKGNEFTADQLDRYWSTTVTFALSQSDPIGVEWTSLTEIPTPSSSTTSSSTTSSSIPDSSSTTNPSGGSSTTVNTSVDSTTAVGGVGGTSGGTGGGTSGGAGSGLGAAGGGGTLPATGVSSWMVVGWSLVLMVTGRMAWLFSRRIRVVDASA